MIDIQKINELIGVDESFKASDRLYKLLMSDKKDELFKSFLAIESDLTYDWFTDYYQEEHSDRKKNKQDFTPDGVVELVNQLLGSSKVIADICAGTGGLTIKRWSTNRESSFYCEEFSDRAMPFLLFNLAIRNINAYIFHGNSLSRKVKHLYKLSKQEQFSKIELVDELPESKADTVVMNPPYSFTWQPDNKMLEQERFKQFEVLAPKSKADYAFLLEGYNRLSDDGTMAIILPHGVLFRGQAEGKIRERLIELNALDAVIGLPAKLFLNTDIPTVVLILKKKREHKKIFFIDAAKEFEKGKNYNYLKQEHLDKIINAYKGRKKIDKFSDDISRYLIEENEFNLNIPRYIDTFEPEEVPSLYEITKEMRKIDKQIEENAIEFGNMLDDLVGTTPSMDKELKHFTKYWKEKYSKDRERQLTLW